MSDHSGLTPIDSEDSMESEQSLPESITRTHSTGSNGLVNDKPASQFPIDINFTTPAPFSGFPVEFNSPPANRPTSTVFDRLTSISTDQRLKTPPKKRSVPLPGATMQQLDESSESEREDGDSSDHDSSDGGFDPGQRNEQLKASLESAKRELRFYAEKLVKAKKVVSYHQAKFDETLKRSLDEFMERDMAIEQVLAMQKLRIEELEVTLRETQAKLVETERTTGD